MLGWQSYYSIQLFKCGLQGFQCTCRWVGVEATHWLRRQSSYWSLPAAVMARMCSYTDSLLFVSFKIFCSFWWITFNFRGVFYPSHLNLQVSLRFELSFESPRESLVLLFRDYFASQDSVTRWLHYHSKAIPQRLPHNQPVQCTQCLLSYFQHADMDILYFAFIF